MSAPAFAVGARLGGTEVVDVVLDVDEVVLDDDVVELVLDVEEVVDDVDVVVEVEDVLLVVITVDVDEVLVGPGVVDVVVLVDVELEVVVDDVLNEVDVDEGVVVEELEGVDVDVTAGQRRDVAIRSNNGPSPSIARAN